MNLNIGRVKEVMPFVLTGLACGFVGSLGWIGAIVAFLFTIGVALSLYFAAPIIFLLVWAFALLTGNWRDDAGKITGRVILFSGITFIVGVAIGLVLGNLLF